MTHPAIKQAIEKLEAIRAGDTMIDHTDPDGDPYIGQFAQLADEALAALKAMQDPVVRDLTPEEISSLESKLRGNYAVSVVPADDWDDIRLAVMCPKTINDTQTSDAALAYYRLRAASEQKDVEIMRLQQKCEERGNQIAILQRDLIVQKTDGETEIRRLQAALADKQPTGEAVLK